MKKIEIFPVDKHSSRILAVGDVFPAMLSEMNVLSEPVEFTYSRDILNVLHDKDISSANLECPLTTINNPISKNGPTISAPPQAIEALKLAEFDVAVLANNHIMDHGKAALQETISICERAGLITVGTGSNLEQACRPVFFDNKGCRIAFLAFAEEDSSCATETIPGAAKLDPIIAATAIQETKKDADLIIVNVHGGNEYYPIPSPRVQNWYRFLVECGADAIIGHHPHTVQGIEIYRNAPIIYSLGNFIFPTKLKRPKCWGQGLMARLLITDNKVCAVEVHPSKQILSNGKLEIGLIRGNEEADFAIKFDRLSQICSEPDLVSEFWKCFCLHRKKTYINVLKMAAASLKGNFKNLIRAAVKDGNISYLPSVFADFMHYLCQRKSPAQQQQLRLKNFLFCDAHLDVLKTIVEMERLGDKPLDKIWAQFEELMLYCE